MLRKKRRQRKPYTEEDEDKYDMIENLVFIMLMFICVGAIVFIAVKYLISFLGGIHVNMPP